MKFSHFSQEYLEQFLFQNQVVELCKEPITLQSGATSHCYVDFRKICSDMVLQDTLADFYLKRLGQLEDSWPCPETILGVSEGMTSLGERMQYMLNGHRGMSHLSRLRAKSKAHGKSAQRHFLGVPQGSIYLVEDTLTTGASLERDLQRTLSYTQETDKTCVAGVLIGCDRLVPNEQGKTAQERIPETYGVRVVSLTDISSLLPRVLNQLGDCVEVDAYVQKCKQEYEDLYRPFGRVSPLWDL